MTKRRIPGARRLRSAAGDDAGFTLLEVVVCFLLFTIVAASATAAIVSSIKASHGSQQRVDAANVAQSFVAATQASPATVRSETSVQYQASVKNEQFVVERTIVFSPSRATQCTTGVTFTVTTKVYQAQAYAKHAGAGFLARSDSIVTC
jgi:Tfp pilus assembly protein PilV